MAPKKSLKSSSSKTGHGAKPPSAKKAVCPSPVLEQKANLLEQADAVESSKRRKTLKRRSTDDEVERMVDTHLPNTPKSKVETLSVHGMKLKAYIKQAIYQLRADPDRYRLGATFWKDLLELIGEDGSIAARLVVKDKAVTIPDDLVRALDAATCESLTTASRYFCKLLLSSCI